MHWSKCVIILIASLLASRGAGDSAAATMAELRQTMESARVVTVSRLMPSDSLTRDDGRGPGSRHVLDATVRADWVRRFAMTLLRNDCFNPTARCDSTCWPTDSVSDIGVRFSSPKISLEVEVRFCERCAQITRDGDPAGSIWFDSTAAQLFELAQEALPVDAAFQTAHLPALQRDWMSTLPPKFSISIYVEHLPEPVLSPPPSYPFAAREARVSGTVQLQVLVRGDGHVGATKVTGSIPLLDSAAVDAVRHWRFRPALSDGKPTAIWVPISVPFTLP